MHNGRVLKKADPSTIQDKLLVGYQGWFTCAGDGEPGESHSRFIRSSACLLHRQRLFCSHPPEFSLLCPRPGPSITNCVTHDTSDSWKRSSRVASLVQLPRPRWRASQYGHLARRVGVRPLRTIRSAGAQNPKWREMSSILFKESKDCRQVRPRRTQRIAPNRSPHLDICCL